MHLITKFVFVHYWSVVCTTLKVSKFTQMYFYRGYQKSVTKRGRLTAGDLGTRPTQHVHQYRRSPVLGLSVRNENADYKWGIFCLRVLVWDILMLYSRHHFHSLGRVNINTSVQPNVDIKLSSHYLIASLIYVWK